MMRFFSSQVMQLIENPAYRPAIESAKEACKKLGVGSISGPLKIVEHPKSGETNIVSAEMRNSAFKNMEAFSEETVIANAKVLEEAQRSVPYW